MQAIARFIRTTILGGVFFLAPIVVLIVILAKAFDFARKGLKAVLVHVPAASDLSPATATLLSLSLVALVCFLAGLVARTATARRLVDTLELSVLSRIPGYEYLKKYEPIGCRDYYTQARLEERGIENYFSGCVTLTLPHRPRVKPEREYVVLVDQPKSVETAVRKQLEGTEIDVRVIPPTRPEPSTELPWETRKAEVERMLDLYQNAKCVVSFRLHSVLPCLALETPVLLVRSSFKSVRFTPYKDWMHNAFPEQVVNGEFRDFLLDPPANPDTYKPVRAELQKTISAFIERAGGETRKASELSRASYSENELVRWQHATMKRTLQNYHLESHVDLREIVSQRKRIARLEKELEKATSAYVAESVRFEKEREKLRALRARRSVQLAVKLGRIARGVKRRAKRATGSARAE